MGGAGAGGTGGFAPGPHAEPPLVPSQGGPVLEHVELVTVTFSDDPHAALVQGFGDWAVGSDWLAAASEYGVGTGTHFAKIALAEAAPATATRDEIEALLVARMDDGTIPAPASADDDRLYSVYFPASSELILGGYKHCESFSGYHTEGAHAAVPFAFAAVGDCPEYVKSLSEEENVLRTASHELIEAATDPRVHTAPGFIVTDVDDPWFFLAGEVADICPLSAVVTDGELIAQRYWSNAAASAGQDPCIPASSAPYFATSASPTSTQYVAAGQSVTFELQGWATEDVGTWKLQALPLLGTFEPDVALGVDEMQNGGTGTLVVTVPPGTPSKLYSYLELFSYQTTDTYQTWPIAIVVP
jgi:hypothetical protein